MREFIKSLALFCAIVTMGFTTSCGSSSAADTSAVDSTTESKSDTDTININQLMSRLSTYEEVPYLIRNPVLFFKGSDGSFILSGVVYDSTLERYIEMDEERFEVERSPSDYLTGAEDFILNPITSDWNETGVYYDRCTYVFVKVVPHNDEDEKFFEAYIASNDDQYVHDYNYR